VLGSVGKFENVLKEQFSFFNDLKNFIPVKLEIYCKRTFTFVLVVTAKLVVSIWLPLIADGTLACNHVTKFASGIVTNCAFPFVKQTVNANKINSFFMAVVLIFNKGI
jgi:hypothetical protein